MFHWAELAGEREREEERKANEGREKSMLLAFQRDDSTRFTKSPRHRQHHGEMGENSCTCLFSIYASVQIVHAFEYICQCVCIHAVLCQKPFKTLFQPSQKESVGGWDLHLFIHLWGLQTAPEGLHLHACSILDNGSCPSIFMCTSIPN